MSKVEQKIAEKKMGDGGVSVAEQLKAVKHEFYAASGDLNSKFDEIFNNLTGIIGLQQMQLNELTAMNKAKDEHIAQLAAKVQELQILNNTPAEPKPEDPKKKK